MLGWVEAEVCGDTECDVMKPRNGLGWNGLKTRTVLSCSEAEDGGDLLRIEGG